MKTIDFNNISGTDSVASALLGGKDIMAVYLDGIGISKIIKGLTDTPDGAVSVSVGSRFKIIKFSQPLAGQPIRVLYQDV